MQTTMTITTHDGRQIEATMIHGAARSDGEHGRYATDRLIVPTVGEFRVGGGTWHTAASARSANASAGLQPEAHPEMHWPGAVCDGDFAPYDIGATIRGDEVSAANYDECGEMEALMRSLGYPLASADAAVLDATLDAWTSIAAQITQAARAARAAR